MNRVQYKRIVSLVPSVTETIFALGCGTRLVGRTSFCDRPRHALEIQDVGGFSTAETHRILHLKPDLIIGTSMHNNLLAPLRSKNISVETVEQCPSFCAPSQIEHIGKILGVIEKSGTVARQVHEQITSVHAAARKHKSRTVCYLCDMYCPQWYDCFVVKSIEFLNCKLSGRKRPVKPGKDNVIASIIADTPDIIIVPVSHTENASRHLKTVPELIELIEIKGTPIGYLESSLLGRPGPSSGEALRELYEAIYTGATK